ncbi:uncharacterized protein B0H18DRAFT_1012076 [Fomitopsis serialis]|uniref:uncharacterized protein n=1 Tax=Fomitopsis serialis TaxID=139415 RepID=UPI0020074416|nr:uncharacterized protein B0H18DRAFT_1023423 [Neoantrodia serialis]XP_047892453.1 uncharacterized protein B0H18DRAFT_1012076 [Neoantrodia serialis]KAH9920722.1 hypothetical protein B0H18DRAFT_1023423 [Neoantrodia serialis]KAH9924409.1 hypothetical protein B0H18DRAFT_1012076 [Neoantrodia serialis]
MASVTDTPTASSSSPELLALQGKLKTLSDINAQLRTVRRIPTQLVKPPEVGILQQLNFDGTLAEKFQLVKDLAAALASESVQGSLLAARASEQKVKGDLIFTKPRETRKRKRQSSADPSPGSPRVYVPEAPQPTSRFPRDEATALMLDGLAEYLKEFNRANPKIKVHVVTSDPHRTLYLPLLLRYSIRDALTIFLTVDGADGTSLIVENATAFASREQKPHHSQSDFVVFQKLTQQVVRIIQSEPQVPLRATLALLNSYENLFSQKCTRESCGRILSVEAHIPPVARVWSENARVWSQDGLKNGGSPGWEPFHPTCLQR